MFPERQSLIAFLDWLRDGRSGFETSDHQFLAAHMLIRTVLESEKAGVYPPTSWNTLLAPILCSSQVQQAEFNELFDKWFHQHDTVTDPSIEGTGRPNRWLNRDIWLYGLAALALAITLGWIIYQHRPTSRPPSGVLTQTKSVVVPKVIRLPNSVVETVEHLGSPIPRATLRYCGREAVSDSAGTVILPRPSPAAYLQVTAADYTPTIILFPKGNGVVEMRPAVQVSLSESRGTGLKVYGPSLRFALMVLLSFVVLGWLIKRWRSALELKRWQSAIEPLMRRLNSSSGTEPLFLGSDIRKLATALRKRRAEESPDLDVARTVEMTCRRYGWFTPVYLRRTSEPEYLFVGERKNLRDQQARLQDEFLGRLRNHDVFVRRYYFQSDPTICSDLNGEVYTIGGLATLYPQHELWLALEADACFEGVSDQLKPWLGPLEQWRDRALLSYITPRASLGMRVVAPTRRGIENLAGISSSNVEEILFPPLLRDNLERWVRRVEPPEANTPLLELQLQRYLGDDGYLLLQACAVYPAVAWNITLALAAELLRPATREDILAKMSALPWFRHGTIPDWMRVRLLSRLGPSETKVRVALRRFLDQSLLRDGEKQEALDIVPGKPKRNAEKLALEDHVFLCFASGKRLDQLSVEAPSHWRKFLRDSVTLRIGFAMVAMGLIWLGVGRVLTDVGQDIDSRLGRVVKVVPPKDRYTAELFVVAQALDTASDRQVLGNSGEPDLLSYSKIASDVLEIENPLPNADSLPFIARRITERPIAPGATAKVGGRWQMVEAVANGKVRLFQSKNWLNDTELGDVYDLSSIILKPAQHDIKSLVNPNNASGIEVPTKPTPSGRSTVSGSASLEPSFGSISGMIAVGGGKATPMLVPVVSPTLYKEAAQKLSGGIGELHFGMSWTEVTEKLGVSYGNLKYQALPVAGEYAPREIHYIWVRLSEIDSNKAFSEYTSLLRPFESCMHNGSQSYIVFDFEDDKLIRVVSRFFNDCSGREEFFRDFTAELGLGLTLPPALQAMNITIGSTNVTWTVGSDPNPDGLDIWQQGSATPNVDILNPSSTNGNSPSPPVSQVPEINKSQVQNPSPLAQVSLPPSPSRDSRCFVSTASNWNWSEAKPPTIVLAIDGAQIGQVLLDKNANAVLPFPCQNGSQHELSIQAHFVSDNPTCSYQFQVDQPQTYNLHISIAAQKGITCSLSRSGDSTR